MTAYKIKSPRKLIEVALPLDVINTASVRESYIYKGNPSSLHKWWAQRPLAAARAVLFAQLVNDPGYQQGGGFKYGRNKKEAAIERKRLFKIIEDLVQWESNNDANILATALNEINRSWREVCELNRDHPQASTLFNALKLPAFYDPFAGGGTIPLEAQRLGLESFASDLNPVAVLINKGMIEIPARFSGRPPVHSGKAKLKNLSGELGFSHDWQGARGLAEDVRYYAEWMREEAIKRVGHLYPSIKISDQMAEDRPDLLPLIGHTFPVLAWLWARTIKSPNPAFAHVEVPLVSNFIVSSKEGRESYIQPVINGESYCFNVKVGIPPLNAKEGTKGKGRGANFRCLLSDTAISGDFIKSEGNLGRIGARMMAIVVDGPRGRFYLSPTTEMEALAKNIAPEWKPDVSISGTSQYLGVKPYGMDKFFQLFTDRQLLSLATLTDLIPEALNRISADAIASGMTDDALGIDEGGSGAKAYAQSVAVYLAFVVSKVLDYNCSLVPWYTKEDRPGHLFSKQAIPMVWDYSEVNIFSDIGGGFSTSAKIVSEALLGLPSMPLPGRAMQIDAVQICPETTVVISTDPPYYDNVPYADLSDFFYVWLRRSLRSIYPALFSTIAVPKSQELVAFAYRHETGKVGAEMFFLNGMTQAMHRLAEKSHPAIPITIYYAFKQSESDSESGTSSTGWETFLAALIRAGLVISGTWPMRTERSSRSRGIGSNALASSIVLVCLKRPSDAITISRRAFIRELNDILPVALDEMTKGSDGEYSPVAPVDLSQAIIGPGMAVFSKYAAVLEADGSSMSVRTALQLINRFLAEDDFDADTQFCLHWFEQHGWTESIFGEADVLARSKSTSVDAMKDAGVLQSGGGKVRLFKWAEYPTDWDPRTDARTPVWEALHQLVRALKQGGEAASGALLASLGGKAEAVRQLAYRLYTLCERLGQAEDARAYNELITSWTGIEAVAASVPKPVESQGALFEN